MKKILVFACLCLILLLAAPAYLQKKVPRKELPKESYERPPESSGP